MNWKYTLDAAGNPVAEPDMTKWARWYEAADRTVAKTLIPCPAKTGHLPGQVELDGIRVSTVFLGLDHGHGGRPLLFETMVFGGPLDGQMDRYPTRAAALAGHDQMAAMVRDALGG